MNLTRFGDATYAGTYRMAYDANGTRYVQQYLRGSWVTHTTPIPSHIRGALAAAAHVGI